MVSGLCRWAKKKRVNVEDIEELRSLRPIPPKFTFSTRQKDGVLRVGTRLSIVPESGAHHGIRIYFRHMSKTPTVKEAEAEEASKLHDLELRINVQTPSAMAARSTGPEVVQKNQPSSDNSYQLYTGSFAWRTGGTHSFSALSVNDFKLISVPTNLTRRFDGEMEGSYMQVHVLHKDSAHVTKRCCWLHSSVTTLP